MFDFTFSVSELAALLNRTTAQVAAGDITGTIALHGESGLGRTRSFVAFAVPSNALSDENGAALLDENGAYLLAE